MKPIRTYEVTAYGYSGALYSARSPAKARYRAYREFCEFHQKTFWEFLIESRIRQVDDPPGIGRRILVNNVPATRILPYNGHRIHFMRDDSDVAMQAHPADVKPISVGQSPREIK